MSDQLMYPHILRAVTSSLWAILPEKLDDILDFVAFKATGGDLTAEEISARLGAARDQQRGQSAGTVAVMPMTGTFSNRVSMMSQASGGASYEAMAGQFRALVNNPEVSAIVLDMDSPGGVVNGADELAAEIYRARSVKPVTAVANSVMASAAYWIGSAASELVVTPSAEIGSIGVLGGHRDESGLYEKLGVKVSLISAGKYKTENNPFEPMTDEGRAAMQARADEAYGRFTRAVAKGRGVSVESVRNGFGEGRVVSAREAVSLGMADRVATIDEVVAGLLSTPKREATAAMAAGLVAVPYEEHGQRVLADLSAFTQATRDRIAYRRDTDPERSPLSDAQRERLAGIGVDIAALLSDAAPVMVASDADYHRMRARLFAIDMALADAGLEV